MVMRGRGAALFFSTLTAFEAVLFCLGQTICFVKVFSNCTVNPPYRTVIGYRSSVISLLATVYCLLMTDLLLKPRQT